LPKIVECGSSTSLRDPNIYLEYNLSIVAFAILIPETVFEQFMRVPSSPGMPGW